MKIILISAAIFTFMILADEMPRFHNDDLVNFYQRNCNESVYNETLVAMDKCLFKKAGKVITEVVSLRDFRLKPTKMKCESIQSWVSFMLSGVSDEVLDESERDLRPALKLFGRALNHVVDEISSANEGGLYFNELWERFENNNKYSRLRL